MDQRLLNETDNARNYIEYPEVEVLISNCCGCPCCCKVAYFPIQNLTFIGHWRKSLLIPITVGIFYFITIACYFFDTYNTFPDFTNLFLSYFITIFSFICFIIGYYAIIIKGPGYVPYNWSKTHQKTYTWEESMRNIAIYNDQVKSAQLSVDRPQRSCFSKDARRFVLRADHFCKLGKSWIGLKNHRYFLLTCFYCFLFSISILLSRFWLYTGIYRFYKSEKNSSSAVYDLNYVLKHQNEYSQNLNSLPEKIIVNDLYNIYSSKYKNSKSNLNNQNNNSHINKNSNIKNKFDDTKKIEFRYWYAFGILTTLIAFFFGVSSLFTLYRNLYNLFQNVTEFELSTKKSKSKWDHGCIRNFEEVCGPKKYILFWPFPFICLEPIEDGFYDISWAPINNNIDSESQNSKYNTMDSLY